ncbi:putative polyol transporter 1 [Henckelia pumila]|uniref:putative polyol transporter 1 n=1 Tax=Henckelia pumila TaxID=405737 RepID=UPI003C6E0222
MRQRRCLELLKDFDCEIKYYSGKSNAAADALSRKICSLSLSTISISHLIDDFCTAGLVFETDVKPIRICAIRDEPELFMRIKEAQKADLSIQKSIEMVRSGHQSKYKVKAERKKPGGLLHRLSVLEWKWDHISMDFLPIVIDFGKALSVQSNNWYGRRYTIVLAGVIFFAGALLMGLATNYSFLMAGRFVAGIGVGYALMIAPVYTAKVAPASSRGFLTSFPEVFINFGILLGYISNYGFSKLPTYLGWRFMLGLGAIPSVLVAAAVLAMPESPRWLVMQGQLGEAKRVLDKTSDSPEESRQRLADIKKVGGIPDNCNDDIVSVPERHRGKGVWCELFLRPTPAVRHILMCGQGIHFFQQASGIDSVVLYSPEIFEKAGIKNDTDKLLAMMAVGFTKTIFILVAMFLLDRIGRRPLLLSSMAGMILSLVGLDTGLKIISNTDHKLIWAISLCIACVLAFVGFFSIGMGPIAWVYSSEIFPLRLRAQGCSMGVAANRVTSGIISMTFLSLNKGISIGGTFFMYAGIACVSWVFFYTLFPETLGKTLEEMESSFGTFFRWRLTMKTLKEKKDKSNEQDQMKNDNM